MSATPLVSACLCRRYFVQVPAFLVGSFCGRGSAVWFYVFVSFRSRLRVFEAQLWSLRLPLFDGSVKEHHQGRYLASSRFCIGYVVDLFDVIVFSWLS